MDIDGEGIEEEMERDTIRRVRAAVRVGRLQEPFKASEVKKVLGIHWAGTFLPKHRVGNPDSNTELFVRVAISPGLAMT